jgi:hypothetical protein
MDSSQKFFVLNLVKGLGRLSSAKLLFDKTVAPNQTGRYQNEILLNPLN